MMNNWGKQRSFIMLAALVWVAFPNNVFAVDKSSKFQVHSRLGLMSGNFSGTGVPQRAFSTPTTIDIEFEIFTGRNKSFNLRTIMAMEFGTNQVNYTYGGMGQTYYLMSRGKKDVKQEKLVKVTNSPRHRYYWGWNMGVAQVLAIAYNPVLSTYSTTLDASVNGGAIFKISDNLGFETRLGFGIGYGFSSVTVTGSTLRLFFGLTYFLY